MDELYKKQVALIELQSAIDQLRIDLSLFPSKKRPKNGYTTRQIDNECKRIEIKQKIAHLRKLKKLGELEIKKEVRIYRN